MNSSEKLREIAVNRMQLIAPLVVDGLDLAKFIKLRREISSQSGLCERTLTRYVQSYLKEGFEGLYPKKKSHFTTVGVISDEVLKEAILLRREVPNRSVSTIIQILEWEGVVRSGELKRSTLQTYLTKAGYSSRQMRMYQDGKPNSRRFQKKHRNQLWQSDIKYGPKLPLGPHGEKIALYMVAFIDDATRFVLHSEFYSRFDQTIVEDCFRKALAKFGAPDAVYFDNGVQYRNKQMINTCSELGIKLLFAKPYSPEAKGKIERFNRQVDRFLDETRLEGNLTLERFNHLYQTWIEECHQQKSHDSLPNNQSPSTTFHSDSKALKLLDSDVIAHAFLYKETRKVDKAGCISFEGKKYQVGVAYALKKVTIIYDQACKTELTIEYEHDTPFTVRELVIGEFSSPPPKLPDSIPDVQPTHSRLLAQTELKSTERQTVKQTILNFGSPSQGGTH